MMARVFFFLFFLFLSFELFAWNAFFSDEEYAFSNYPESISSPGLVFQHQFNKKRFRIFYHHKNIMDEHMNIMFSLTNPTEKTVVVNIQKGLGGSSKDVVFAGHKALVDFFQDILSEGELITLPPQSTIPVLSHKIKSNQTSSGIVRFDTFEDADLSLKMMVLDSNYSNLTGFIDVPSRVSQFRVSYFDESIREIKKVFDLSDKYTSFEIGGKPFLKDKTSNFLLKGNYGLVYGIEIFLTNFEDNYQNVEFFLAPTKKNGVDRAIFLIDGKLVEVGFLNYKENVVMMEMFHEVIVAPNESKKIFLMTMPQAGCFYPVDIVLKSRDA